MESPGCRQFGSLALNPSPRAEPLTTNISAGDHGNDNDDAQLPAGDRERFNGHLSSDRAADLAPCLVFFFFFFFFFFLFFYHTGIQRAKLSVAMVANTSPPITARPTAPFDFTAPHRGPAPFGNMPMIMARPSSALGGCARTLTSREAAQSDRQVPHSARGQSDTSTRLGANAHAHDRAGTAAGTRALSGCKN